jgi:hypothetical protein
MDELFMNMTPLKTLGYLLVLVNLVAAGWLHVAWIQRRRVLRRKRQSANKGDLWVIRLAFGLTLWIPFVALFALVVATTGFLISGFGPANAAERLTWQICIAVEALFFLFNWAFFSEMIARLLTKKR